MGILVVVEHDGLRIRAGSKSALGTARLLAVDGPETVELLVIGSGLERVAADAMRYGRTIVAEDASLAHVTADRYARLIADVAASRGASTLIAADTTFAKDILPRVAALMGSAMVSGVTGLKQTDGELLLSRPMYAGAVLATVSVAAGWRILSIRASAFPPAEPGVSAGERVEWPVNAATLPGQIEFVKAQSRTSNRPELTEARTVVSGGRPFRTSEEFETFVGGLAHALNGAAGCTRALVDAGVAPNEWQVGQTGKVVAPELYVALGISGAIQHLAGMRNSRFIVAVNSDPEAAIFSVANYGLVGDVRQIVPELIRELQP